jgi:hypothetical protein
MGKHKCKSCKHKKCKCKTKCKTCCYGHCVCKCRERCTICGFGGCICVKTKCTVCGFGGCICVKTTVCGDGYLTGGVFGAIERARFGGCGFGPYGFNSWGNCAPLVPGCGFNPFLYGPAVSACVPIIPTASACAPCGPIFRGCGPC